MTKLEEILSDVSWQDGIIDHAMNDFHFSHFAIVKIIKLFCIIIKKHPVCQTQSLGAQPNVNGIAEWWDVSLRITTTIYWATDVIMI